MPKIRVSGPERREMILDAARRVFSQHGYDGAKTLQIAREAQVSEALVYRHYPSKLALYRAVLRKIFREQDESYNSLAVDGDGTESLVGFIHSYFRSIVFEPDSPIQNGYRMTMASLAGDGGFARLVYRRAQRKHATGLFKRHEQARENGDIVGEQLSPANTTMFVEHVGTMLTSVLRLPPASRPYDKTDDELVRDAVWFCCRGIGLSDEAIARHIDR